MYAGQQLVDHFHFRPGAGVVAQFVDLDGNGLEHCVSFLECGLRSRTHDGKFALGGAPGAAGYRGIDQQQAFRFQPLAEVDGEFGRDGAAGDDDRAFCQGADGAILAEQHIAGLVGVYHQDDDDRSIAANLGRAFRGNPAFLGESLGDFWPYVESMDVEPLLDQRARHADAHRTQSDHAHRLFLSCQLTLPCCRNFCLDLRRRLHCGDYSSLRDQ